MKLLALALVIAAAAAAGCARLSDRPGIPPSMEGRPAPQGFEPLLERLEAEGERNWVLNLNHIALAALRAGDRDLAKAALDESILQIEIIYGDSPQARRARALFYAEDSKIFKGDPYERSMAYFYRGVLFMQDREWANARACFRSALLMDEFAEDQQFRADWSIFHYLIGVCEAQLGRPHHAASAFARARASYAQFRERYPTLQAHSARPMGRFAVRHGRLQLDEALPDFPEDANLLVITQQGRAPVKLAGGRQGELLTIARGGSHGAPAMVRLEGRDLGTAPIMDCVFYQAVTRGGRELDHILGRQAQFKEATGTAGTVGLLGGAVLLSEGLERRSDGTAWLGAGLLAVGGASALASGLSRPEADTRAWRSLPETLGLRADVVAPGVREVEVALPEGPRASAMVSIPPPGMGLAVVLAFPGPAPVLAVGNELPPETVSPGQMARAAGHESNNEAMR